MRFNDKLEFDYVNVPTDNTFYFFGDNLLESIELVELFEKYNEDVELIEYGFHTVSQYIKKYKINNEVYTFVLTSYFHNGELPDAVRQLLIKNDKPDVIIYSAEKDEVIFGVESTVSTLAGNATWQRTARATSFIKEGIPFAFISYFSKRDMSAGINTPPRRASDLFVATYIALSLQYSVPALIGFYEHEDRRQNLTVGKHDWREEIMMYFKDLIVDADNKDVNLIKCYENMRNYYYGNDIERFVDSDTLFVDGNFDYVKDPNFASNIVNAINNHENHPLFNRNLSKWRNKSYIVKNDNCENVYVYKLNDVLDNELSNMEFYQLTGDCKAGITFDTPKLINFLNSHSSHRGYFQDNLNRNYPTVILPTKFRKSDSNTHQMISTQDPYNGEIPAFYELYNQSFGPINFVLLVFDHSNITNYSISAMQRTKVYRTINNYVNLVIDKDYNYLSNRSEEATIDSRNRYENEYITENDVTCLLRILLSIDDIEPSFINPPSGSWSDLRLYPTDRFYYYARNDERADIAYYDESNNTYYVGESKDNYNNLKSTLHREEEKVEKVIHIIEENINMEIPFKRFAAFGGTVEEAKKILNDSNFDFVMVVQEQSDKMTIYMVER